MASLKKTSIKYSKNIKRSPEVEEFIKNGGTVKVISPEETRKTLEKQSGGYFKGQSVMGRAKRIKSLNYHVPFSVHQHNPLPWTEKWISGGAVQVAPQETEITSYVLGGVTHDVNKKSFEGLSL